MQDIRKNQRVFDGSTGEATDGHDITVLLDGGFTCIGTMIWMCNDGGSFQAVVCYDTLGKYWQVMHGTVEVLRQSIERLSCGIRLYSEQT